MHGHPGEVRELLDPEPQSAAADHDPENEQEPPTPAERRENEAGLARLGSDGYDDRGKSREQTAGQH
jgi:hypothetical protein